MEGECAEDAEVHETTIVYPLGVNGLLSQALCVEAFVPLGRCCEAALEEASANHLREHLVVGAIPKELSLESVHVAEMAERSGELREGFARDVKLLQKEVAPLDFLLEQEKILHEQNSCSKLDDVSVYGREASSMSVLDEPFPDAVSAPAGAVFGARTSALEGTALLPFKDVSDQSHTVALVHGWAGDCEIVCNLRRLGVEENSVLRALAVRLQRAWRGRRVGLVQSEPASGAASPVGTSIELGWTGKHEKRLGKLVSHVRFLQWLFRAVCVLAPGCWASRMVPAWVWVVLRICRRPRFTKCRGGTNLAGADEFLAQQTLANEMLDWYGHYAAILKRLNSGEAIRVFDDFCGGGAVAEGIRRGGGVPFGDDFEDQPAYKIRFGADSFTLGDGVDWSLVRRLQKRHGLRLAGASPPCKWYSTARRKGESKQPPLIGQTRDMLKALFDWYWIENVMGAKDFMSDEATEIDGPFFGLKVFRSRLFETNFKLYVDKVVSKPAALLRARMCLGRRNRWRTFDEFGRPYLEACCSGNAFVPIGETPWRCTTEECALAMGLDKDHMPYDRLAQAVPPAYSQWVFGQMCMRILESEYNCPVFTFDEMRAQPGRAQGSIRNWLLGIGFDRPSAGMSLVKRWEEGEEPSHSAAVRVEEDHAASSNMLGDGLPDLAESEGRGAAGTDTCEDGATRETHGETLDSPDSYEKVAFRPGPNVNAKVNVERTASAVEVGIWPTPVAGLSSPSIVGESIFRELYYAHFGNFNCQWSDMGGLPWLSTLRNCTTLSSAILPTVDQLLGQNTYLEVSSLRLDELKGIVEEALYKGGRGTRVTIVTKNTTRASMFVECQDFNPVNCELVYGGDDALRPLGLIAFWCGRRAGPQASSQLLHEDVEHAMDPRDRGEIAEDKDAKRVLTWTPISHNGDLWKGKGLPADVEAIMSEGVRIDMDADSSCFEQPQYPFPDDQSMMESLLEADRALLVGHMEYVPEDQVAQVVRDHIVHPWLMVWQGKWRLCQDYSEGTNRAARSGPFGLPTAWDALKALKPGAYMAKYDLRDFFWSIPVHKDSRCRLVMRHPGTGRLMWCKALPFGYLDSPRQACRVSEALAGEMRKRAAGKGINFFCYVDDYLVVGDTKELTQEGEQILQDVMREFGMQWAPAKRRGPAQCMEFLGLLLCNVEGHRCMALSKARQAKLRSMIDEWLALRVKGEVTKVPPVEVAKLLGHLVFASQVVPGGRTYMQSMLSTFGGLEIDWKHGRVRPKSGHWGLVELSDEFWLDLEWWSDHLELRNCVPIDGSKPCEAMVAGTDASDWGAGTVAWIDGHKEECNLQFSQAERRRPINFRELLGIVRVLEIFGHRLQGCKIMIETDNMAAKGAAEKLASTAYSMQEMIRRLYECAEVHNITVKLIHTPGAKLFRPDQTSRGDPIEEPRVRLRQGEFALLNARFGPFTEFVGAERRHSTGGVMGLNVYEEEPKLWLHPAHNTVGTALRLIGERMAGYDGDDSSHRGPPPTGVIVVPYAPEARWWMLVKHFTCVGRWEIGSTHLEMNQMGIWRGVRSKRTSLALLFPRSAGQISPVEVQEGQYLTLGSRLSKEGYVAPPDKPKTLMLPLVTGSIVFSPAPKGKGRGELLLVWDSFRPHEPLRECNELGNLSVSCAELLHVHKRGQDSFEYHFVKGPASKGGSFANGGRNLPWEVDTKLLWVVDHLVQVDAPQLLEVMAAVQDKPDGHPDKRLVVAELAMRSFHFDYKRAMVEIEKVQAQLVDASGLPAPSSPEWDWDGLNAHMAGLRLQGADGAHGEELAEARASADEAAMLRTHPKVVSAPPKKVATPVLKNRRETVCRYTAQKCEGCRKTFAFGETIIAGVRSMIHPDEECYVKALARQDNRIAESKVRKCSSASEASEKTIQSAKIAALADGDRLTAVRNCLAGKCDNCNSDEPRVMCLRGCGRGLHLVGCARTSKSYAAAGRLICIRCRLDGILEGGLSDETTCFAAPESLVQQVALAMMSELTSGAVTTAHGRDQFATLERRWMSEICEGKGGSPALVVLPRHSIESFATFMWWLVTDADRARSFATIMRAAGSVMTMLELTDWTKTARIKAQIKEIAKICGVEPEPCTQTTRRIVKIMIGTTISAGCSKGASKELNLLLIKRTLALLTLELMAGLRVGEATSSGDLHGLSANGICFLVPACEATKDDLGTTVEVRVLDSKTGPGRYAAFVAKSKGELGFTGLKYMNDWLLASKISTDTEVKGGYRVVTPNYWVARVNVASMSNQGLKAFLAAAERSLCPEIFKNYKATEKYAKERHGATSLDADYRYVNVAGGSKIGDNQFDTALMMARDWLEESGYGKYSSMVPGPLIRATLGKKLTHMPLATKSTYTHLAGAMEEAYEISSKMEEPDVEFDLQGLDAPKWGNHSLRRHSDKVARESLKKHTEMGLEGQVTKQLIDFFYGWLLKDMNKDMQWHYAGLDRWARRALARVSMYM